MRVTYLQALQELSKTITLNAPLDSVFNTALEQMVVFLGADAGSIQLLNEPNVLHTVAVYGDSARRLYEARTTFTVSEAGLQPILDSNRAWVIRDMGEMLALSEPIRSLLKRERLTGAVFVALKVQEKSIGTLSIAFHKPCNISRSRLAWFEAMTNLISVSVHNAQLLNDLRTKQAELQNAWKAVTEVQETERRRLSRELHDEVGQALTSLMLRLKALQSETDIEVIGDRLNGLRYLTGQTLEEVRRISMDLRPVVFDELGLIPAIRWYVRECAVRANIEINFHLIGTPYPLRPELEIACYRAVQEGLTNIIRHARAAQAGVELTYAAESVKLVIHDDGVGMIHSPDLKGVGLVGMQERIRLVGGRFTISSEPGAGVTLTIVFPSSTT